MPHNPRQTQFLNVVTRDEATARFQQHLRLAPLGRQTVPLGAALGRILAEDIRSMVDVPGFDRSNVDGFAVQAADTHGAMEESARAIDLNDEVLSPGIAPQRTGHRGARDDDRDRRDGAARRRRRRDGRAHRRWRRWPASRRHARRRSGRERQLCRHRHREGRNRAARGADADVTRDRRARGGRACRGARLSQTARRDPVDRKRDRRAGRVASARHHLRFERGDHRRRSRRARRRAGATRDHSRRRRGALGGARPSAASTISSCSPAERPRAPATSRTGW